jgi:Ca2+-binding RTX toxin-like protein
LSSPVDVYRSEFFKNANLTFYKNVLDQKNLSINDTDNLFNYSLPNQTINLSTFTLLDSMLGVDNSNFLETPKKNIIRNDLLFLNTPDDSFLSQNTFKK